MSKRRSVTGGGVAVEVEPDRLVGWVNRFGGRNGGLAELVTDGASITLTAGDGTTAVLDVPFGPMAVGDQSVGDQTVDDHTVADQRVGDRTVDHQEPLEALLHHLATVGAVGIVLVRGGAHSVGIAKAGTVLSSSTDRAYLQGRTAAGGWSQQRFARRRDNQRTASYDSAASTAARILLPSAGLLHGLVLGGDRRGLAEVLADSRLAALAALPRRIFADIPEPRRTVLDEIAARSLSVEITIRTVDIGPAEVRAGVIGPAGTMTESTPGAPA